MARPKSVSSSIHDKLRLAPFETRAFPNWKDFRTHILDSAGDRAADLVLYRGQRETRWILDSPLERRLKAELKGVPGKPAISSVGVNAEASKHLNAFRRRAVGLSASNVRTPGLENDDAWEILARHHGVVTRLLDWSESAFVASFFALIDVARRVYDGFDTGVVRAATRRARTRPWILWELRIIGRRGAQTFKLAGKSAELIVVTDQLPGLERQRAQRGAFTKLADPSLRSLDRCIKAGEWADVVLTRYSVTVQDIASAIFELDQMNIRYDTVFPDLDGTAIQANIEAPVASRARSDAWVALMVESLIYSAASNVGTSPGGGGATGRIRAGDIFKVQLASQIDDNEKPQQ